MRTTRNRRDMRPDSGRARGRRGTATQIMNSHISEVQDRLSERLISLTYERPALRAEQSLTRPVSGSRSLLRCLFEGVGVSRAALNRGPDELLASTLCVEINLARTGGGISEIRLSPVRTVWATV